MLTRVLAIEWGGDGIRVNSVVPGPIEGTEGMLRLASTDQAREIVRATVPAARWGTPRDVADVCLFLASPLAAYVTGVVLPADGGWSLAGRDQAPHVVAQPDDRRVPVTTGGVELAEPRRVNLPPAGGALTCEVADHVDPNGAPV